MQSIGNIRFANSNDSSLLQEIMFPEARTLIYGDSLVLGADSIYWWIFIHFSEHADLPKPPVPNICFNLFYMDPRVKVRVDS